MCPECFKKAKEQEQASASVLAASANKERGCVTLKGSEKQVAWAETLRLARVAALETLIEQAKSQLLPDPTGKDKKAHKEQKLFEFLVSTLEWAYSLEDAKWWIDNKDKQPSSLQNEIGQFLDMFNAGPRQFRVEYTEADLVRGMCLLSPHMNEAIAEMLGLKDVWLGALEQQTKQDAEMKTENNRIEARDEARALGLSGSVKVWVSNGGDHKRIYADQFTYFHTGKNAGTLKNKSMVGDTELKSYCDELCEKWQSLKFYA